MRGIYVLSILLVLAINAEEHITESDHFDIDGAVADIDSLKGLVGCVLDTAECGPAPADFKKDIAEATPTACSECTDDQKAIFHKFLAALKEKLPTEYEEFKNKHDHEGHNLADLEAAVA